VSANIPAAVLRCPIAMLCMGYAQVVFNFSFNQAES